MAQSEYDLSEDKLEIKDLRKCTHVLRFYSTEENLQSRHVQENSSHKAKTSVDCTDCRIHELTSFEFKCYSHKFHGAGVRYEIAICIVTSYIVWINAAYHVGHGMILK